MDPFYSGKQKPDRGDSPLKQTNKQCCRPVSLTIVESGLKLGSYIGLQRGN